MSVGLAGVRAAGRRGQQGGGVRLEGASRAGDRAGGPLLIWQADTTQAGQIGQVVTVGGAVLPGADRGGGCADRGRGRGQKKSQGGRRRPFTLAFSFLLLIGAGRVLPGADRGRGRRALVPAAPDPPARGTGHGSRWHRSRAAQFRRRMIRQNSAGRRGQILHLTAYRSIGNGELGSMPPYYPPLAPFFPGFRRGESITGHSFGASLQDIGLHTLSSRRRCCPDFSAPIFRGSNLD